MDGFPTTHSKKSSWEWRGSRDHISSLVWWGSAPWVSFLSVISFFFLLLQTCCSNKPCAFGFVLPQQMHRSPAKVSDFYSAFLCHSKLSEMGINVFLTRNVQNPFMEQEQDLWCIRVIYHCHSVLVSYFSILICFFSKFTPHKASVTSVTALPYYRAWAPLTYIYICIFIYLYI